MPVFQSGEINTTALIVPDLYVQIVPPSVTLLNGVPTNALGVVGTATWGPVGVPTVIGDMLAYASTFGALRPRKHDAGSAVAAAALQRANNFRVVRVTDGTDTAASAAVQENALVLTSRHTGSLANGDTISVGPGSRVGSWRVTVARPGAVPESFDNIVGEGAALWAAMASAINDGQSGLRGPSALVVATPGVSAAAPVAAVYNMAGGTDGAAVTQAHILGADAAPRRGMYALRGSGASIALLADCDDRSTWSAQVAFGLAEGCYMILTGPQGESIADAVAAKATAGIDSYIAKVMLGDWVYINDTVNGLTRAISPQGWIAGRLANLSPEQSSLNKPIYGLVGTQQAARGLKYSSAELEQLGRAGIDVICNPVPGGNYFGARFGHNSASNPVVSTDNYTRLTNYIAYTLSAGMGLYVGRLQSPETRRSADATISSFLDAMWQQGMIGAADGSVPYSVQINDRNNPHHRVALGYMQADVQVVYLSVIEKFIINVEGGQSVVVTKSAAE